MKSTHQFFLLKMANVLLVGDSHLFWRGESPKRREWYGLLPGYVQQDLRNYMDVYCLEASTLEHLRGEEFVLQVDRIVQQAQNPEFYVVLSVGHNDAYHWSQEHGEATYAEATQAAGEIVHEAFQSLQAFVARDSIPVDSGRIGMKVLRVVVFPYSEDPEIYCSPAYCSAKYAFHAAVCEQAQALISPWVLAMEHLGCDPEVYVEQQLECDPAVYEDGWHADLYTQRRRARRLAETLMGYFQVHYLFHGIGAIEHERKAKL